MLKFDFSEKGLVKASPSHFEYNFSRKMFLMMMVMMMMMMMMMNCFCGGTIVRDPHHRESLTRCGEDVMLY